MDKTMYNFVEIERGGRLCADVKQDPVHPPREKSGRVHRYSELKRIFAYTNEEKEPLIIGCIKLSHNSIYLMDNIFRSDIMEQADSPSKIITTLTFYSIFRTDVETKELSKNLGFALIQDVTKLLCEEHATIKNIKTLSPIPTLSNNFTFLVNDKQIMEYLNNKLDPVARFHLHNHAKIDKICQHADDSDIRLEQSFGWMAAYDYTDYFFPLVDKK